MAWQDRLREAAYTSPGGTRVVFLYEDVTRSVDKRTSAYNFPDADGTYIQDLGHTGRRYPLRVIFSGGDYDIDAGEFEDLLLERGVGVLEHPTYGRVDVVPFGTVTRRDALKTAANQAIIEIEFWESTGLVYPTVGGDPASAIATAVDEFNSAQASLFERLIDLLTEAKRAITKGEWSARLDQAKAGLQAIADTQAAVAAIFDAGVQSIENSLDVLIGDPLTLAFQTSVLLQAPARALTAITDRLDAYAGLAAQIFGAGTPDDGNLFHSRDVYASTYITGSVVSVINHQFSTKPEAVAAADALTTQLDDLVEWRDTNFDARTAIDTGESYQQLQQAVALAAGYLIEISFSLKQERRVTLTRARTAVDLVAELYGSVDDQLDFFIESNSLTGSEILEIPAGREIVYYV